MYFSCTVKGCRLAGRSLVFSKSGIIPNMRLGGGAKSWVDKSRLDKTGLDKTGPGETGSDGFPAAGFAGGSAACAGGLGFESCARGELVSWPLSCPAGAVSKSPVPTAPMLQLL